MFDEGARMQGIAILSTMALSLLGGAMAWSEITGKCLWIRSFGNGVLCVLSALLAISLLALFVSIAAAAMQMIFVGR